MLFGSLSVLFTNVVIADNQSVDFSYQTINGGTQIEITGYSGSASELALPSVIDNKSVTSIGPSAFFEHDSLTVVVIPDSVVSIGSNAVNGCRNLNEVDIGYNLTGSNLTSIGDDAFFKCISLVNVSSPSKLSSIGELAFAYCTSLSSTPLSNSVKLIGDGAFEYCRSLQGIIIPDNVTSIENDTFLMCTSFTNVVISENVTSIHHLAFGNCTSLIRMEFKGNAPQCDPDWVSNHSAGLTIYYAEGATGFTSPTWQGIPTELISAYSPSAPILYGPSWTTYIFIIALLLVVVAVMTILVRRRLL